MGAGRRLVHVLDERFAGLAGEGFPGESLGFVSGGYHTQNAHAHAPVPGYGSGTSGEEHIPPTGSLIIHPPDVKRKGNYDGQQVCGRIIAI
jgi:hypothetical protein